MKTLFLLLSATCLFAATAHAEESNATTEVTAPAQSAPLREPTKITSDRLQVDYANNVGTFEGNVLVIDPQITLRADKMTVFFGGTGTATNAPRSLSRVIADGGVVITQEERKATSDHAEYSAQDGKVVLTGKPRVEQPGGSVSGERITFWRGESRMDVESAPVESERTRVIIYPDAQNEEPTPPTPAPSATQKDSAPSTEEAK
jgi:lipopolysaccharide export system protein LptA